jgi:hypothetical protein
MSSFPLTVQGNSIIIHVFYGEVPSKHPICSLFNGDFERPPLQSRSFQGVPHPTSRPRWMFGFPLRDDHMWISNWWWCWRLFCRDRIMHDDKIWQDMTRMMKWFPYRISQNSVFCWSYVGRWNNDIRLRSSWEIMIPALIMMVCLYF